MKNKSRISKIIPSEADNTGLAKEFMDFNEKCDKAVPEISAKMFISLITPRINKKAVKLKEKRKKKKEWQVMLLAYILIVPFVLILAFDYVVNGWEGMITCTIIVIALLSLLLLACIPLLKKYIEDNKN